MYLFVLTLLPQFFAVWSALVANRMMQDGYAHPNQFPFVASIRTKPHNVHLCAGSIVHIRWILTAAVCFYDSNRVLLKPENLVVHSGTIYSDSEGNIVSDVDNLITHPDYSKNGSVIFHNIALLDLNDPFFWLSEWAMNIRPIKIGRAIIGTSLVGIGWGSLRANNQTDSLLNYQTFMVSGWKEKDCQSSMDFLCATRLEADGDKCFFDAGGPLINENTTPPKVIALMSHVDSSSCGSGKASLFTRVESYFLWIKEKTGLYII